MKNSIFRISTKKDGVVFDIKFDGSLWWTKNGKLTQANTDKELNLALAQAIKSIYLIQEGLKEKYEKIKSQKKTAPKGQLTPKFEKKLTAQKSAKGQKHSKK